MFDDAKQYLSSSKDPVMWDLINGLSEMAKSLNYLESETAQLKRDVADVRQAIQRLSR